MFRFDRIFFYAKLKKSVFNFFSQSSIIALGSFILLTHAALNLGLGRSYVDRWEIIREEI